jgi:hypothetical protein
MPGKPLSPGGPGRPIIEIELNFNSFYENKSFTWKSTFTSGAKRSRSSYNNPHDLNFYFVYKKFLTWKTWTWKSWFTFFSYKKTID